MTDLIDILPNVALEIHTYPDHCARVYWAANDECVIVQPWQPDHAPRFWLCETHGVTVHNWNRYSSDYECEKCHEHN